MFIAILLRLLISKRIGLLLSVLCIPRISCYGGAHAQHACHVCVCVSCACYVCVCCVEVYHADADVHYAQYGSRIPSHIHLYVNIYIYIYILLFIYTYNRHLGLINPSY